MKIFQPKFFVMSHKKIGLDRSKGRPHGYAIYLIIKRTVKYEMSLGDSCCEEASKFRFVYSIASKFV